MTDRYPLIKSVLGIQTTAFHTIDSTVYYVLADELERALEKGVRVYGNNGTFEWSMHDNNRTAIHKAYLIGITEIERDSMEQLVRDLAAHDKFAFGHDKWLMNAEYWIERAKKVLAKDE